jgi:hypothetical protein
VNRFVLVICVAALGCRDPEVAELERISTEVCACSTSKCAQDAIAQVPKTDQRSTPRTQALARRMLDCLAKLQQAERDHASEAGSDDVGSAPPD